MFSKCYLENLPINQEEILQRMVVSSMQMTIKKSVPSMNENFKRKITNSMLELLQPSLITTLITSTRGKEWDTNRFEELSKGKIC